LITLLGSVPRVFAALSWAREPVWDAHYYHFGAQRIAQGLGYSAELLIGNVPVWHPWCHYPVGYSALLGTVYRVFGHGQAVGPSLNVVIGALTIVAAHRLARIFLSKGRSRWAAVLVAAHPGLIAYTAVLMTEPLAALSLLLAGLCAFATLSRWREAITGFVIGLAALVRPPSLLALPALLFAHGRPYRKAAVAVIIAGLVALITIAPWTVRNCRVMDGCALISTNGGWNLAIGALTPTGRFHTLRAEDGCRIVTGQVQQDRCWASVGWQRIVSDPWAWLAKIPAKLENTFNHESFPIAYLAEADPRTWHEERQVHGRILLTTFHHLLLIAATLAVFSRPRDTAIKPLVAQLIPVLAVLALAAYSVLGNQPSLYWLAPAMAVLSVLPWPGADRRSSVERYLFGTVAMAALTSVIFFGEDRYHLVVSPILCILAAAALRPPCSSRRSA
jgi:4-amino-4-deoxy-L-arabinose transferase-like glycosyltransferase